MEVQHYAVRKHGVNASLDRRLQTCAQREMRGLVGDRIGALDGGEQRRPIDGDENVAPLCVGERKVYQ